MSKEEKMRFQSLRDKQYSGTELNDQEQRELEGYFRQLESEEAAYLSPANQRISKENKQLQEQNVDLQSLLLRQEKLAQQIRQEIEVIHRERERLLVERKRLLSPRLVHEVTGS